MANKKISELNSASNLQATDLLVVVNGGETRKTTLADLNQALIDDTSGAEGSCHVATTGNVNTATGGLLTIDGLALQDGYRVLAWKQTAPAENGIYVAHSGAWTRAADFSSTNNVITGSIIAVTFGSAYKKSIFQVTTVGAITVGTTPITIERISGWQFDETVNNVFLVDKSITIGSRGTGPTGVVYGTNSLAQGTGVIAQGNYSSAFGSGSKASGANAHAEGSFANANGANSHAEGAESNALGTNSHAEGTGTTANGIAAHSEGNHTSANNTNTHAEGDATTASGDTSHAQGKYTTASGAESHTGGLGDASKNIVAAGIASFNHSFNNSSQTQGNGARGDHSAILGGMNNDIATGATDAGILAGSGNQVLAAALRSVILGGTGISATDPDTAYAKIVRLLSYLTINNNSLLGTAKANTIENDGKALFYTDNSGTVTARQHLAAVENLRVAVPFGFATVENDNGGGTTLPYLVSISDAGDYFTLPSGVSTPLTGLSATLVVDVDANNTAATGEVMIRDISANANIAASIVTIPTASTSFSIRKSAVFTLSPNKTYGIYLHKTSSGLPTQKVEIRSAQLILQPKF
jgi:hypothetical protein